MTVTALLVSHDGARWLPAVLDGPGGPDPPRRRLHRRRHRQPRRAVPTCSAAACTTSPCTCSTGSTTLSRRPSRRAWTRCPRSGDGEWIWLLHDDANPAPDALRRCAGRRGVPRGRRSSVPSCASGPRCKRLLEVGLTITGTGHRETGLERGEYDQGQHDEVREVLAVNTAGHARTPQRARGARRVSTTSCRSSATTSTSAGGPPRPATHDRDPAGGGLPRRGGPPRRPSNAPDRSPHALPGAPGRPVHDARQRAPAPAAVAGRAAVPRVAAAGARLPRRALGGRGARRARRRAVGLLPAPPPAARRAGPAPSDATGDRRDVRRLLAPPWLPYRHGLDFVTDLAAAATNQAQDVAERRRAVRAEQQLAAQPASRDRGPPRRGRRGGLPPGLRPRGAVRHQPGRDGADPLRRARGRRARARRSARSPAARCPRCPPTSPTGGGCTSRRGTRSGPGTDVPAPAYVLPVRASSPAWSAAAPVRWSRR